MTWEDTTPYTERGTRTRRISWANLLILLNLGGFVATGFLKTKGTGDALAFLEFDATMAIGRFHLWQFFTYSFIQVIDPWFIVWMVLGTYALYTLGNELEAEIGGTRYLVLYLSFAAYGAGLHALYQYTQPAGEALRGVSLSGPVAGIAALAALRMPHRPVLFFFLLPMRLRTAVGILGVLGIVYGALAFPQGLTPALGGAAAAVGMFLLEPRIDRRLEDGAKRRERDRFVEEVEVRRQADLILDKIARDGMDSLTRRERKTLKQASVLLKRQKKEAND